MVKCVLWSYKHNKESGFDIYSSGRHGRIVYGDEIGVDIGVKGISFFHVHPTFGKNSGRTYAGDWSLSGPDMETLTDLGANVAYLGIADRKTRKAWISK